MPRTDITKNQVRYRLVSPKEFIPESYKTKDIGRKGHSQIVMARKKDTGEWANQSVRIARSDYNSGLRVKRLGKGKFKLVKIKGHKAKRGR